MSPENHIGFLPALGRLQRTLRCLQSKGFLDASADVRCMHMPWQTQASRRAGAPFRGDMRWLISG